mgnify:CR=1 FL=1
MACSDTKTGITFPIISETDDDNCVLVAAQGLGTPILPGTALITVEKVDVAGELVLPVSGSIFHEDTWEENHSLLERADRIIICVDDEQNGWSIFWILNKYYKLSGRIDLRSSRKAPGVPFSYSHNMGCSLLASLRTQP